MDHSYTILAPTVIPKGFVDAKVATEKVVGAIQLDENDFKFGHTKARSLLIPFVPFLCLLILFLVHHCSYPNVS